MRFCADGMGQQMYLGDHGSDRLKHAGSIMEHLACFVPGMLALGHYHGIETGTFPPGSTSCRPLLDVHCETYCV